MTTTRAAIYVRISVTTEESTSIDRQLEDCRREIDARGWLEADVYRDLDRSAFSGRERPELERMLSDVDAAKVDVVIFWKLDRLARSTRHFYDIMDRCERANVALVSVKEPIDLTTPIGKALVGILAVLAQLESDTISMRVSSARRYMDRNGQWVGGNVPYGWVTTGGGETGKPINLVLDPETAPVLREAVGKLLGGASLSSIEKEYGWGQNSAHKRFSNPWLIGQLRRQGQLMRDDEGRPVQTCEPLLTRSEFDRLQLALDARKDTRARASARSSVLRGLALCGVCGKSMTKRGFFFFFTENT